MKNLPVVPTLTALALATALGLNWHFFVQPLNSGFDESCMLEAAVRHADGHGLTTSLELAGIPAYFNPEMTVETYRPLTWFAPLYSLLASWLLQAGLSVAAAVKVLAFAAMALGLFGWLLLASRGLREWPSLVLFALLVVVAGGADVPIGHTSDYLLWALTPYWLLLLWAARQATAPGRALGLAGLAAVAAGVAIGLRWASVFLIPAGMLALLWPGANLSLGRRWRQALVYGIPPVLVYVGLTTINRLLAGPAGAVTAVAAANPWDFAHLASLYPWQALFAIPLGIEPMVLRVWRAVEPAIASWPLLALFQGVIPLLLLGGLVWAWRRSRPHRQADGGVADLRRVIGVTAVTLVAFLAAMTVRFNVPGVDDWGYFGEPRYYRLILPAAALFWLTLVEELHGLRWARTAALALLTVGVVYLLQAQVRFEHQYLTTTGDSGLEVAAQVRGLAARDGLQVVYGSEPCDYERNPAPNLITRLTPDPEQAPLLTANQPADLWLIRWVHATKHQMFKDPQYFPRRFEALAKRFNAQKVWTSSDGKYELYYARIGF